MDPRLQALLAKDEIRTRLNGYALGMDLRRTERFLDAWHEDGHWWINAGLEGDVLEARGHEEIRRTLAVLWSRQQAVVHLTGNHEIALEGADRARGESHAVVVGVLANGRAFFNGVVYPDDRYERRDGAWKLARRRVEVNAHVEYESAAAAIELFPGFGGAFPTDLPPDALNPRR